MQLNYSGTLESRMRGNVQVRFGGGLSEEGGNGPRREPTQPLYVGPVDGAREDWLYLEGETSVRVVNFFHATQYIGTAADPRGCAGRGCVGRNGEPRPS